jgi:hypothetical protein
MTRNGSFLGKVRAKNHPDFCAFLWMASTGEIQEFRPELIGEQSNEVIFITEASVRQSTQGVKKKVSRPDQ